MLVGNGDIPAILSFYENCGFIMSHRLNIFFVDNYDHPMYENGIQLIDMVYLGLAEKLQNALNANFGKRKFIIDKKIERGFKRNERTCLLQAGPPFPRSISFLLNEIANNFYVN